MRRRWRGTGASSAAWRSAARTAASVAMVAEGEADIAAIDFVSWRYAQAFMPEAARLRVLMLTDPRPGLPYIAAAGTDVERHAAAVAEGLGGLDAGVRETLGIAGLARVGAEEYGVIAPAAGGGAGAHRHLKPALRLAPGGESG